MASKRSKPTGHLRAPAWRLGGYLGAIPLTTAEWTRYRQQVNGVRRYLLMAARVQPSNPPMLHPVRRLRERKRKDVNTTHVHS